MRVPECEILLATHAVKNFIRTREFFKIATALETGADHDMWTFARYAKWLDGRTNWFMPGENGELVDSEPAEAADASAGAPPVLVLTKDPAAGAAPNISKRGSGGLKNPVSPGQSEKGRIEIEPTEGGLEDILKKLG